MFSLHDLSREDLINLVEKQEDIISRLSAGLEEKKFIKMPNRILIGVEHIRVAMDGISGLGMKLIYIDTGNGLKHYPDYEGAVLAYLNSLATDIVEDEE